jgi:hypothetical protein
VAAGWSLLGAELIAEAERGKSGAQAAGSGAVAAVGAC